TGAADVHGPATQLAGGEFDGTATGTFNQKAAVTATGGDGIITIQAPTVNTTGAALVTDDTDTGGEVNLIGCTALSVDQASLLSSVGPGGFNLLEGGTVAVHGTVHADPTLPVARGTGNPCTTSANCIQYVSALDLSGAAFSLAPETDQVVGIAACVPPTTTTTLPGGMTTTTTTTTTSTTTTTLPVCGNGVLDPGEQCDDGPRNGTAASCCSSTCTVEPAGTPCADDGNLCTADVCSGTADTCTHPAAPAATCTTPMIAGGAALLLSAPGSPKPERVGFQWGKGPAVPLAAFGTPGSEPMWLCVYDETGPDRWALAYAGSPSAASGTWSTTKTGWRFKSRTGMPTGITGITFKAATVPLAAKLTVAAKGHTSSRACRSPRTPGSWPSSGRRRGRAGGRASRPRPRTSRWRSRQSPIPPQFAATASSSPASNATTAAAMARPAPAATPRAASSRRARRAPTTATSARTMSATAAVPASIPSCRRRAARSPCSRAARRSCSSRHPRPRSRGAGATGPSRASPTSGAPPRRRATRFASTNPRRAGRTSGRRRPSPPVGFAGAIRAGIPPPPASSTRTRPARPRACSACGSRQAPFPEWRASPSAAWAPSSPCRRSRSRTAPRSRCSSAP